MSLTEFVLGCSVEHKESRDPSAVISPGSEPSGATRPSSKENRVFCTAKTAADDLRLASLKHACIIEESRGDSASASVWWANGVPRPPSGCTYIGKGVSCRFSRLDSAHCTNCSVKHALLGLAVLLPPFACLPHSGRAEVTPGREYGHVPYALLVPTRDWAAMGYEMSPCARFSQGRL